MPDGLTQDYIDNLMEWQAAGLHRSVGIKIETHYSGEQRVSVWCWDGALVEGESVTPPAMPDIPAKVKEQELKQLEELKAKYQKEGN